MPVISNLINQKGSTTIVALMGIGLLAFSVSSSMLINSQMLTSSKTAYANEAASSLTQSLMVMFSDPNVCSKGANAANPGGGLGQMIRFVGPGWRYSSTTAQDVLGQEIMFPSSFKDVDGNNITLASTEEIPELNLRIDRIYFKELSYDASTDIATGEVYMAASSLGDLNFSMRSRKVANISIQLDTNDRVDSCIAMNTAMSAETMCADMGCNYDDTDADGNGQACDCPLPSISCTGVSNGYIRGMTIDGGGNLQPMCGQAYFECAAADNYLEGFNPAGSEMCAQVSVVAAAATPTPTPSGCMANGDPSGGDHAFAANSYNSTVWTGSGVAEMTNNCCSNTGTSTSPSCPGMNCAAIDMPVFCTAPAATPTPMPTPTPAPPVSGCSWEYQNPYGSQDSGGCSDQEETTHGATTYAGPPDNSLCTSGNVGQTGFYFKYQDSGLQCDRFEADLECVCPAPTLPPSGSCGGPGSFYAHSDPMGDYTCHFQKASTPAGTTITYYDNGRATTGTYTATCDSSGAWVASSINVTCTTGSLPSPTWYCKKSATGTSGTDTCYLNCSTGSSTYSDSALISNIGYQCTNSTPFANGNGTSPANPYQQSGGMPGSEPFTTCKQLLSGGSPVPITPSGSVVQNWDWECH